LEESLRHRTAWLLFVLGGFAAQTSTLPELRTAAATMTPGNLLRHIRELSSDAYGGRLPGTPGEEKSVAYVISQIKAIGLQPGTPAGGFVQQVPLYGIRSRGTITITASGKDIPMAPTEDFVLWSTVPEARIDVRDSDLVFAGYGVVAPEYAWNDYGGIDVKGKTVMVLTGDPPVAESDNPTTLDEHVFLGNALTVYGRTGTKLATAFKHGAAAVLLVAPAQPFRYVWQNNARENMTLRDGSERKQINAQALVTTEKAAAIFAATGNDFAKARAAAAVPGFQGVALSARVTIEVNNEVRRFESQNILAKIEGSDSALKNEYVIFSGHWDHHGREGDRIFHGASDNAAGTAGVLELARAFRSLNPAPKRTVIFLWPTAEEKGLLGARYYVDHPLYPLASTVANINLDYFSNWGWGRTRDFSIVGIGNSTLDDLTADAVRRQGRTLTGDTAPEMGFYFRSDHYEFARVGVPSLETSPGIDYVGKSAGFGETKRAHYIANDYHNQSDVIKPDWDLLGAVEDLQILLEVGYRVAQQSDRPTWKTDAVWRPRSSP
jgi:Zn-dependent M28 family amino/carboxypeptidase